MAATAAQVTMLQRSPTYITSLPATDAIAMRLRRCLPPRVAHRIVRAKNVLLTMLFFTLSRRHPEFFKRLIRAVQKKFLPADYAFDTHFQPTYQPWDQRLCVVPDGDLFKAIRAGKAAIVTDRIEGFVEDGIRLASGQTLAADIIVTATGLKLKAFGGARISVDGTPLDLGRTYAYNGVMLRDVPNMAFCVGYTNASWTLRADLSSRFVCRLLAHMDRNDYAYVLPKADDACLQPSLPLIDFTSSYVLRAIDDFPRQGPRSPWRLRQNYLADLFNLKFRSIDDGTLSFHRTAPDAIGAAGEAAP
jgi:cation diffusion facilitator CzcD-associated flavoprotein CzcO